MKNQINQEAKNEIQRMLRQHKFRERSSIKRLFLGLAHTFPQSKQISWEMFLHFMSLLSHQGQETGRKSCEKNLQLKQNYQKLLKFMRLNKLYLAQSRSKIINFQILHLLAKYTHQTPLQFHSNIYLRDLALSQIISKRQALPKFTNLNSCQSIDALKILLSKLQERRKEMDKYRESRPEVSYSQAQIINKSNFQSERAARLLFQSIQRYQICQLISYSKPPLPIQNLIKLFSFVLLQNQSKMVFRKGIAALQQMFLYKNHKTTFLRKKLNKLHQEVMRFVPVQNGFKFLKGYSALSRFIQSYQEFYNSSSLSREELQNARVKQIQLNYFQSQLQKLSLTRLKGQQKEQVKKLDKLMQEVRCLIERVEQVRKGLDERSKKAILQILNLQHFSRLQSLIGQYESLRVDYDKLN